MAKDQRPSARAQGQMIPNSAARAEVEPPTPPHVKCVAFSVVEIRPGVYQPMKLEIELKPGAPSIQFHAIHDPMAYEALAYQYLQGDVSLHYEELQIKRTAAETRKPNGR